SSFAGLSVDKVVTIDGTKLILSDGSWVLIRPSGTEPVVRFYAEAFSVNDLDKLTEAGKKLILG
ncbi:MAG: phosphoglucomutase/phosphomannomutase family protein, partial [Deltaproteobacteria bacterium]